MLVLSRKIGERVLVGDSIVMTILESRGHTVKIGIEAPRALAILRAEIGSLASDDSNDSSGLADKPARPEGREESEEGMAGDRIP